MWVSKRKMPKATSSQWPILTQSREGFGPTLSISWKRTTSSTQPHPLWLGWLTVKFNVPKIQKERKGTELSQMSLVSQQQPWHPAWSRRWVQQSTMQDGAGPPRSPNIWQCSTFNPTDTKNENRRDVIYLSSACSRCKCYLPQPQALILALWVERDSPSPMTERLQIKRTGMAQRKWQNGSYC